MHITSAEGLSPRKRVVWSFYKEMWDHGDKSLIPGIFHDDFTFRGSLGPVLVGHAQFAGYVDQVRGALASYTSDIQALVEEDGTVFGRLTFHGIHRAPLFGIAATERHVAWSGVPMFTFDGPRVRDLWVLGDVHGLLGQLRGEVPGAP